MSRVRTCKPTKREDIRATKIWWEFFEREMDLCWCNGISSPELAVLIADKKFEEYDPWERDSLGRIWKDGEIEYDTNYLRGVLEEGDCK